MSQRQSLALPPSQYALGVFGSYAAALHMAQFMMESHGAETPLLFLDKENVLTEVGIALEVGFKYDTVDDFSKIPVRSEDFELQQSEEQNNVDFTMGAYSVFNMGNIVACVLAFPSTGNAVCVVGSYVIDVVRGVFIETDAPEYDIQQYINEYGDASQCYGVFVRAATGTGTVATVPVAGAPKTKKAKTVNPKLIKAE